LNFFHESGEHVGFGDNPGLDAFSEDDGSTVASSEANVSVFGFTRAVDLTAHNCDFDWGIHGTQELVNSVGELSNVDVRATTGRAGDHLDTFFAQAEGLQDFVANLNFLLRFVGEGDANGVTDAFIEKNSQANSTT
jgi:hypothetical protein